MRARVTSGKGTSVPRVGPREGGTVSLGWVRTHGGRSTCRGPEENDSVEEEVRLGYKVRPQMCKKV